VGKLKLWVALQTELHFPGATGQLYEKLELCVCLQQGQPIG
jgi:hypothetical protein